VSRIAEVAERRTVLIGVIYGSRYLAALA
jgi:hypothetical protein